MGHFEGLLNPVDICGVFKSTTATKVTLEFKDIHSFKNQIQPEMLGQG